MNYLEQLKVSMSTIEIAELTRKRHDNVIRDTRSMLLELYGEKGLLKFEGTYIDSQCKERPCFNLQKNEVLTLISGYSIKLRMKIIIRLETLEKGFQQLPDFSNPAIAARAWADEVEQKSLLQKTVNDQKPKVDALDRIAVADGSMNTTAAAKHLQVRPKDLFIILLENKWYYRRPGNKNYLGYQDKIQQGLLEHKVTTVSVDGVERVYEQVRITPKGLIKLAGIIDNNNLFKSK